MHPSEDEFIYVQANGDFINWATANIGNLDVKIDTLILGSYKSKGPLH